MAGRLDEDRPLFVDTIASSFNTHNGVQACNQPPRALSSHFQRQQTVRCSKYQNKAELRKRTVELVGSYFSKPGTATVRQY